MSALADRIMSETSVDEVRAKRATAKATWKQESTVRHSQTLRMITQDLVLVTVRANPITETAKRLSARLGIDPGVLVADCQLWAERSEVEDIPGIQDHIIRDNRVFRND